jgi:hypothetical protein
MDNGGNDIAVMAQGMSAFQYFLKLNGHTLKNFTLKEIRRKRQAMS